MNLKEGLFHNMLYFFLADPLHFADKDDCFDNVNRN